MKFSPSGNLPSVYLKPYIATHGQFTRETLAGYLTRGLLKSYSGSQPEQEQSPVREDTLLTTQFTLKVARDTQGLAHLRVGRLGVKL